MSEKRRNVWIYALVGLQSLALAGFVGWWLMSQDTRAVDGGFGALLERVRTDGAPTATLSLGRDVVRAGVEACHFEACVATLFNGDMSHYRKTKRDTKTDRCAGYTHDGCTRDRARRGIEDTLKRAATFLRCEGRPLTMEDASRAYVDVVCVNAKDPTRKVLDRVHLKVDARGGYLVEGEDRFPGFLPAIYADLKMSPEEP